MPLRLAADGPRVRLTLGQCLFIGMFNCPCTAGSVVANLKDLGPDSQCGNCGHAVSLHQEVDESPSDTPQPLLPWTKPETGDLLLFSTPPEPSISCKTDPTSSPVIRPQQHHSVAGEASTSHQLPHNIPFRQELHRTRVNRYQDSFVGNTGRGSNRQTGTGGYSPFETASDPLPLAHGLQSDESHDNTPYICPRTETVSTIAGIVKTRGAVLIWGLPGSGKSTLGQLVFEHLSKQDTKAVFINDCLATKNGKLEELLAEFCQPSYPGTSSEDVLNGDFVFIIDEAHKSLQKLKRLIKTAINTGKGPKFCMLSDQGVCADRNSVFEMLPEISYLATHGACADNVGIFYSHSEFEEVFSSTTAKNLGYRLNEEAAKHVFSLTAGHPSIVGSILCYIDMYHAGPATPRRRLKRLVSLEGVVAVLHDDTRLFQYLGEKIYPGTFARQSNIALKVFQKLLSAAEGRIRWNAEYNTTGKCFENGLVCHEIDAGGEDTFKFPSPLHERTSLFFLLLTYTGYDVNCDRWARWYHMIQPRVYEGLLTPVVGS